MKQLSIDRGAVHGGNLQGRKCADFVQNADELFQKFLEIDKKAISDGAAQALIQEARTVNRHFNKLAILTDCILHCISMDYDTVNACKGNLILNAETCLKAFVWM